MGFVERGALGTWLSLLFIVLLCWQWALASGTWRKSFPIWFHTAEIIQQKVSPTVLRDEDKKTPKASVLPLIGCGRTFKSFQFSAPVERSWRWSSAWKRAKLEGGCSAQTHCSSCKKAKMIKHVIVPLFCQSKGPPPPPPTVASLRGLSPSAVHIRTWIYLWLCHSLPNVMQTCSEVMAKSAHSDIKASCINTSWIWALKLIQLNILL